MMIHILTPLSTHRFYCLVPENIHTPTTEGIGNSEGVGGSKPQEITEGRGVGQSILFPDALRFNTIDLAVQKSFLTS